jgi:hypothetical protein
MIRVETAIRCNASVIVTFNGKDFPAEDLSHYAWRRNTPTFWRATFSIWILRRLSPQPSGNGNTSNTLLWEWDEFLETLLRQGIVQTSQSLATYRAIL